MNNNAARLGFGHRPLELREFEEQIDEGISPMYWYVWTDMGFDDDNLEDQTYEERRFEQMWQYESLKPEEESDDFPCDEAVECSLLEER